MAFDTKMVESGFILLNAISAAKKRTELEASLSPVNPSVAWVVYSNGYNIAATGEQGAFSNYEIAEIFSSYLEDV